MNEAMNDYTNTPVSRIEFITHPFEFAHGKAPRGDGNWGFCPRSKYGRADYLDFVYWFNGRYGDAKKAAAEHFSKLGVVDVVVCS